MAGLAGFKAGKEGVQLAMRNNEMYLANLKQGLNGVPRTLLATLAAASLEMAVKKTIHDSSRFAANWDLAGSGTGPALRLQPSPKEYEETTETAGKIGKRGSKGAERKRVLDAKASYYGYTAGSNGIPRVTRKAAWRAGSASCKTARPRWPRRRRSPGSSCSTPSRVQASPGLTEPEIPMPTTPWAAMANQRCSAEARPRSLSALATP